MKAIRLLWRQESASEGHNRFGISSKKIDFGPIQEFRNLDARPEVHEMVYKDQRQSLSTKGDAQREPGAKIEAWVSIRAFFQKLDCP